MSEDSCKICRGEATPTQPLLHPCSCKGLIKYIHESCLLQWLNHSNKSKEVCDICGTNYKFKLLYDPSMPEKIPLNMTISKIYQIIKSTLYKLTLILFFIQFVLFEVPIFFKFFARVLTWVVDGSIPQSTLPLSLFFGESLLPTPSPSFPYLFLKFLSTTLFSGIRYIFIFIIVHIAVFLEHEWVVRDDGFKKMFEKYVGKEPKQSLKDLLEIERIVQNANGPREIPGVGARGGVNGGGEIGDVAITGNAFPNGDNFANDQANALANGNPTINAHLNAFLSGTEIDDDGSVPLHLQNALRRVEEIADGLNNVDQQHQLGHIPFTLFDQTDDEPSDRNLTSDDDMENNDERDQREDEVSDSEIETGGNHARRFPFNRRQTDLERELLGDPEESMRNIVNVILGNNERPVYRDPRDTEIVDNLFNIPEREANDSDLNDSEENANDNDFNDPENQRFVNAFFDDNDERYERMGLNIERDILREDEIDERIQNDLRGNVGDDVFDAERNEGVEGGAVANQNGGVAELFESVGLGLNLQAPLIIMFLCNILISAYLFVLYLVPHLLGNLIVGLYGYLFKLINLHVLSRISNLIDWNSIEFKIPSLLKWYLTNDPIILISKESFSQYLLNPATSIFKNLLFENKTPYSLLERILMLTIGYTIIIYGLFLFLKALTSGVKPVMGIQRKFFRILFEVAVTTKVFMIFAIETVFFPVYCGFLLDFCLTPLLISLLTKDVDGTKTYVLLFTSNFEILQHPFFRVCFYWLQGTGYMLFFALFVGMVRTKILRPGVLFFIRSPDDPNANLIHDALVKPLSLQLSRIYLSAKVYTGFILVGIGGVTWAIRGLVYLSNSTDPKLSLENVLLPIQVPTWQFGLLLVLTASKVQQNIPLLSKYIRLYWVRVFEICCHKLRLSHFIVGKPIHQERGYVVYRSIIHQLLGIGVPDFTRPVSYKEALKLFKEKQHITAVFVPNGTYVRAPEKDTVSRKFIKKLFVLVTKDDKLLAKNEPSTFKSGYDTPTSEEVEDSSIDNGYIIVYRPPNFKLRCLGLILFLWSFAVILILSVFLVSVIIGRPVVSALATIDKFLKVSFLPVYINWKLIDPGSVAIGHLVLIYLLKLYDQKIAESETGSGGNEVNAGVPAQQENRDRQANRFVPVVLSITNVFLSLISWCLWVGWVLTVHLVCIDLPLRIRTGYSENDLYLFNNLSGYPWKAILLINPLSITAHFAAGFWTFVPTIHYFVLFNRAIHMNEEIPWRIWMRAAAINFAILNLPASIITIVLYVLGYDDMLIALVWLIALILVLVGKSVNGIRSVIGKINDQVKSEKYVTGRAIENVE